MSEGTESAVKTEETEKTAEAAPEIKFTMPSLERGAATFYDTNTKQFWVGIPLDKADPVTCLAILDRSKFDLLQHWNKMAMEAQRLRALQAGTGVWDRGKKTITNIFDKLVKHQ